MRVLYKIDKFGFAERTKMAIESSENSTHFNQPYDICANYTEENYWRHNGYQTAVLVIAYSIILVTGFVGNSMVIYVVAGHQQMRSVQNLFIMNLALADWLVIVFCGPATLLSQIFCRKCA